MKEVSRRTYAIHAALGVATGLVLYAVTLTGTAALFEEQVLMWEHPSLRFERPRSYDIDRLLRNQIGNAPEGTKDTFVFLPSALRPSLRLLFVQKGHSSWVDLHPATGAVLPSTEYGFGRVWRLAHTNALMGQVGRYLVGLSGLVMLLMLLSGIAAHRKVFSQLFTWRYQRSLRVSMGDLHKLVGVWSLPVHFMFSFTGAILGLLGALTIVSALVAYGGDRDAAVEAVLGPPVEPAGVPADIQPLSPLFAQVRQTHPHIDWNQARLIHWKDENAHVELGGFRNDTIAMPSSVRIRWRDGAPAHEVDWVDGGAWRRVFGLILPLHFASFGGLPVKVAYAVLGLLGAVLIGLGLWLWLERKHRRGPTPGERRLSGLTAGVLGGFPLATLALPLIDRAWAAGLEDRVGTLTAIYVSILAVSALAGPFVSPRVGLATLFAGAGIAALGAALFDTLAPGAGFAWSGGPVTVVNAGFCLTGAACLAVAAIAARVGRRFDSYKPLLQENRDEKPSWGRASARRR